MQCTKFNKYHVPVLIALFTSLYLVALDTEMILNSEKISRFSRCGLRPALGAILRDIGIKISRIQQCRALGTHCDDLFSRIIVSGAYLLYYLR